MLFGVDLNETRGAIRQFVDTQVRLWAGFAFMALAMLAIQYDEVVAPEVHRLSDGFSSVATDMSRKLTSFTL